MPEQRGEAHPRDDGVDDHGLWHVLLDCEVPNIVSFVKFFVIVVTLILIVFVVIIKSVLEIGSAVLDEHSMKKPKKDAIIIDDSRGTQTASPAETHREQ
eukprot:12363955-Heterocapsa_arctica.AAC.1